MRQEGAKTMQQSAALAEQVAQLQAQQASHAEQVQLRRSEVPGCVLWSMRLKQGVYVLQCRSG